MRLALEVLEIYLAGRGGFLLRGNVGGLLASSVLEQIRLDGVFGNLDVTDDTTSNKAVFYGQL